MFSICTHKKKCNKEEIHIIFEHAIQNQMLLLISGFIFVPCILNYILQIVGISFKENKAY